MAGMFLLAQSRLLTPVANGLAHRNTDVDRQVRLEAAVMSVVIAVIPVLILI
ncbi:MAG: hypothetical protein PVI59_07670 [Anaerolineae bacterium]|jgi:hypothetical protein